MLIRTLAADGVQASQDADVAHLADVQMVLCATANTQVSDI